MSVDQVALVFESNTKERLVWVEAHAGIIWAMASGKYKTQKKGRELSLDDLKKSGILKEA